MKTRLTLKAKLIGMCSAIACVSILVGGIGYWSIHRTSDIAIGLAKEQMPSIEYLLNMRNSQFLIAIQQLYLNNRREFADDKMRNSAFAAIDKELASADSMLEKYAKLSKTGDEAAAWNRLLPLWDDWKGKVRDVVALAREKEKITTTELAGKDVNAWSEDARVQKLDKQLMESITISRKARVTLASDLDFLIQFNSKEGTELAETATAVSNESTLAILIVTLIGFTAAIILGITFGSSISRALVRIIDGLRTGSGQVTAAAGQVASASQELAQGASEQASNLEETSASVEQISSMTRQNSDVATQADSRSRQSAELAEFGATSMKRMQEAIERITGSATETAKVIKTIDEIAFQTNLLALNAAVEAARAGEAGKGFAVVAEEVRNLARRSAEAAKTTADLIEGARKNAEDGVTVAAELARNFGGIRDNISKTATLVGEIAAASKEQSQGIDQVNTAIAEMDKVVQQNAANAEESASASEELSSQAEELNSMVEELVQIVGAGHGGTTTQVHSVITVQEKKHPQEKPESRHPAPHKPHQLTA